MVIDEENFLRNQVVFIIRTHKGEKFPFEYIQPEIFYSLFYKKSNGDFGTMYFETYKEALRYVHINSKI